MLQCIVNITLIQVKPYTDTQGTVTLRNEIFNIGFCHSFEVYSSWKDMTDTAIIELPKNVYVRDINNSNIIWGESTTQDKVKGYVNAGGFGGAQVSKAPLIMRGDEVYITAGYSYISQINPDGSLTYATKTNNIFHGFVSSIESKSSLKIHCEDFMWLLKQTAMPSKTYSAPGNDISNVLNDIVNTSNTANNDYLITSNTLGFTLSVDGFSTGNETAADVLNKLKKIMPSMAFYFRDTELRGGGIIYYPQDQGSHTGSNGKPAYNTFNFQKNIISDDLQYSLKNDVNVGAVCYSVNSKQLTTSNKMGGTQYNTSRLQTTVGVQTNTNSDNYEYYTFYFKDQQNETDLQAQGNTYLSRYQYDGFRGKFTTFGLPFIQHGNIITLSDNLFPEHNGNYMVKGVHFSFSIDNGIRQEIELHFRTDNIPQAILQQGM
jgi:hypothetical protein